MRLKSFCLTIAFVISYLFSSAFSVPVAPISRPAFGDTLLASATNLPLKAEGKKMGFFQKAKYKVASFFLKKELRKAGQKDAKNIWGFTALGLLVGGVALVSLSAGVVGGIMIIASLIATIVALTMQSSGREKNGSGTKTKRRVNWGLITAILAGIGLVGLIIALASWSGH